MKPYPFLQEEEKPKKIGRLSQLNKQNSRRRKLSPRSEFLIMAEAKEAILGPAI